MPFLCELVFQPRLLRGEGHAVNHGVGLAQARDDLFGAGFASVILRLAQEDKNSACAGRLLTQKVDPVIDGIEDCGAAVAGNRMGQIFFEVADFRDEV